jgi:hypothetical protein
MDLYFSIVTDEPQFAEFVHEKAHAGTGRADHSPFTSTMRLPQHHHHPIGTWGQVLGRGLVPRLSIGTLQLSIRCSSIHFLPSRSFPVSAVGVLRQGCCVRRRQVKRPDLSRRW